MRVLRLIHRWIGLVLAIVLGVAGLTGSLLFFKAPYYRAQWPALAQPITADDTSRYAAILESIDERFADVGITRVKFPQPGMNAFHVWLGDGREALIDSTSGDLVTMWTWRSSVPAFLFELHAHLLAGDTGSVVNGIAALGAVFLALSGVLLWWPRRRRAFRLCYAVPRDASATTLLRSHAANGLIAALPILLFAGTGAALVFYTPVAAAMSGLLDRRPPETPSATVPPRDDARQPWHLVLAGLQSAVPDGQVVFFQPGTATNGVWTFRVRLPGEWHPNGRSYVLIDPYSAAVVQTIDAREQGIGTRAMFAVYPLHAATVGGKAMVVVAIVSGLALTWLSLSGAASYALAWRLRIRRRRAGATPSLRAEPTAAMSQEVTR